MRREGVRKNKYQAKDKVRAKRKRTVAPKPEPKNIIKAPGTLKGSERTHLRGLAHSLKPYVHVGKDGITTSLTRQIIQALNDHELIKIKFVDFKENKKEIAAEIETATKCECVGLIGHIGIFYKQHPKPEKRRITWDEK